MKFSRTSGFTIVELLIVIVVIGILSAVTIVAFNGVSRNAVASSMKVELNSAAKQLNLDKGRTDSFPASLAAANEGKGIVASGNSVYQYSSAGASFCLTVTSSRYFDLVFSIDQGGTVKTEACPGHTFGPPPVPTNEACFAFISGVGQRTVTDYYAKEGNNSANPSCPRNVVIPDSLGGSAVTGIQANAFKNKQLTGVVIPSTVTWIGGFAFENNQLTAIVIPNSVTSIANNAFNTNSLTSVSLPTALTAINTRVFANNQLTTISIPASVTSIGDNAFANNQLTTVTIPSAVTSIGSFAFRVNQLSSVTVPVSVTSIGLQAFAYNNISSVTISSTAVLGETAFDNTVVISYY